MVRRSQLAASLSCLVLLGSACAATADYSTQPQRRTILEETIVKHVEGKLGCTEWKLTFKKTEKLGDSVYDYYDFDGCGQKTEFFTLVETASNGAVAAVVGAAPSEADFQEAAAAQVKKTAEFDTDCKELELTMLNALVTGGRGQFEATLGVTGCGKKTTYHTNCQHTDYSAGKHKIVCSNVSTTDPAAKK